MDELSAAIAAGETAIAELQAQVVALTEEKEADSAEAAAQVEALNVEITTIQNQVNALTIELEAANAELQKRIAELEAYKLERELADGEAHAASTLDDTITVDADGVTAHWNYINNTISGNAVVLTITAGDEELFVSEALKPGDVLESFTLTRALEAGSYEALVATSVTDAEGAVLSSTRVPVCIVVG